MNPIIIKSCLLGNPFQPLFFEILWSKKPKEGLFRHPVSVHHIQGHSHSKPHSNSN